VRHLNHPSNSILTTAGWHATARHPPAASKACDLPTSHPTVLGRDCPDRSASPEDDPWARRLDDSPYKSPTNSLSLDDDCCPSLPPPAMAMGTDGELLPTWVMVGEGGSHQGDKFHVA